MQSNSRAPVDQATVTRLVKLLGMLGSAHDGEIAAAGRKASEYIRQHRLQWSDVIAAPRLAPPSPPPRPAWQWVRPWQKMVGHLQVHRVELSAREREFIDTLATWRREPTSRQYDWLSALYARVAGAGR
jgi:hypothetical protein